MTLDLYDACAVLQLVSPSPLLIAGTRLRPTDDIMSTATASERGSGKRIRRATANDETSNWTLGQSFNAGQRTELLRSRDEEDPSPEPSPPSFISKLPAAVANVSQDMKSYVHSKRVTNYLVGSTLGEGSFAKVKEGFHTLVGEKVAIYLLETSFQPIALLPPAGCCQDH